MQFNFRFKYLGIILIVISGYFFLFYFSEDLKGFTFCLFKNYTGLPCPSCGSTRSTIELFHGNILKSLLINPLGIITNILLLTSTVWIIKDIITNKETFLPALKNKWPLKVLIPILIIVFVNWIWNIFKGL